MTWIADIDTSLCTVPGTITPGLFLVASGLETVPFTNSQNLPRRHWYGGKDVTFLS